MSAAPRSILIGNHRSPKPTIHPNAFSVAKLVAGDSVHVGDHGGYPRVRLDLLSTPMFSDHQGTPPFAGNPRRSSASVRSEGDDTRVDWSNLTSGPGGPTVSDPAPVHTGVSDPARTPKLLTGYNFLITTPNELILFPTSLKFDLVYFKIYLKKFQNNFLCCFEFVC